MVALQVPILSKINSIQLDYKSAIARELEIFTSVKALILKGVIPDILTNIQSSRPTTASAQCANKLQNITHRFDAPGKFFTDNLQSSKHQHASSPTRSTSTTCASNSIILIGILLFGTYANGTK